ncbi:uncharacterized protein LOC132655975 [Meriones unguiculatus]|uniref:uncharacterized protein LOC132655975 n=1 Tax=Meriones unguiculatus TaxID=10047 RepID=UPI00293E5568|nr:uncharacterized protein LOC132655975 [Meriones unguiculatus]
MGISRDQHTRYLAESLFHGFPFHLSYIIAHLLDWRGLPSTTGVPLLPADLTCFYHGTPLWTGEAHLPSCTALPTDSTLIALIVSIHCFLQSALNMSPSQSPTESDTPLCPCTGAGTHPPKESDSPSLSGHQLLLVMLESPLLCSGPMTSSGMDFRPGLQQQAEFSPVERAPPQTPRSHFLLGSLQRRRRQGTGRKEIRVNTGLVGAGSKLPVLHLLV